MRGFLNTYSPSTITAYFRFENLSAETKSRHGIKAQDRLDCTAAYNPRNYKGLSSFVNSKGQLYLYRIRTNRIIRPLIRRKAKWALSSGRFNLSSMFLDESGKSYLGYGFPNANKQLVNGRPNPLYPYRNDCYLFITTPTLNTVEVFIIKGGRHMVQACYQRLLDGGFDHEIAQLRVSAQPMFDYWPAL
jgi:hypothetical protein